MTQKSWPWSTVAGLGDGASELGESDSREVLALYFKVQDPSAEGVSKGVLNELEVSGVASPLAVDTGSAVCYGLYINDAAVNLTVTTPSLGTTGGRVVLQTNWAGTGGAGLEARTRLAVIYSADGNPAIPALTQSVGVTWEISLATFTITTGGAITLTDDRTFRKSTAMVDTDEIVNDSVSAEKAGDGILQFIGRQGGSASNWDTPGANDYTPGAVLIQAGSAQITFSGGSNYYVDVTFPQAFSDVPIVLVSWDSNGVVGNPYVAYLHSVSNTVARIYLQEPNGVGSSATHYIKWLALGPE